MFQVEVESDDLAYGGGLDTKWRPRRHRGGFCDDLQDHTTDQSPTGF
jgi:hypothetical protein